MELVELVEELGQDLSQLSLDELSALVEETRCENAILKLETDMFEKHVNWLESQKMATEQHGSLVGMGQVPYGRGRHKSKSHIPTECPVCLTMEQKCNLVQRELEETKEDMRRVKENSERIMQYLQRVLEEADIPGWTLRKPLQTLKKIIKTITKKKGSIIASKKVLKYMEDMMRLRDALKEKYRLKNNSLKVQVKKMQTQLKQKEELGEALHEVDFQQLGRIDHELILAEAERAKAEALNKKLQKQLAKNKVLPVLDYVHETMAIQKLK